MPTSLPASMRHVAFASPGDADVLHIASAALPAPRPNEVLIRVRAAGVNRADVVQRQGLYPPPPDASPLLGLEVAGEIAATGEEVTALRPGDRVCALTNGGGYAEYCVAPAVQCLPWPTGYDAIRAAALPETCFTVWANVFGHGRLARGEWLLVHGGSSGIGMTAIQLAREFGARVIATAGSADKCQACIGFGAEGAIQYRDEDFAVRVADLTGGRGVDVILDMVGAPYFDRNLASLARDGRLVVIATQGGHAVERFDLRRVMMKRLLITGSALRPRSTAEKGSIAHDLREQVWPILNAGRAAPHIHAVFPMADVASAQRLMESGQHIGKIVLRVAD
jgi:NADPH:quinone reductase